MKVLLHSPVGLDKDDLDTALPVSYAESQESSSSITIISFEYLWPMLVDGSLYNVFEQHGELLECEVKSIFLLF